METVADVLKLAPLPGVAVATEYWPLPAATVKLPEAGGVLAMAFA